MKIPRRRFCIFFTASKLMAYLIFFVCVLLSIYFKDSSIFTEGLVYTTALLATKTITNTVIRKDKDGN